MIDNLVAYEFFKDADYYGVCETAANTAAKVVTIPDFTLENGVGVMVKFKNSNTTNSPTLNVSGTGAKPIYIDPSVGTSVSWEAWKVLPFVYDGTNWQLVCDPGIAVTQIPTDDSNNDYEVLFSKTPDNLEHMEEVRKSQYLNYNPNQRTLFVNDGNEHVDEVVTNSVLNRSYLTNNELGVIKTSNNVTISLKVRDNDIVLAGTGNTWDGSNTSLKDTVSALGDTFVSPTTSVAGKKGMVPAPAVIEHVDNKLFLRSDGTWDFEGVYRETQYTDDGAPQNFYCDGNGDIVIVNNWTPQRKIDKASDGKNGIYYNTYFNDNYQIQRGIPQDGYEISLGSRGIYLEINTFDDYTKKKNNIPVSENTSSMDISAGDIVVSTTWDGTNTSLKSAITQLRNTVICNTVTATFSTSTGEISEYITSATLASAGITNLSQWTITGLMYNDPGYNDNNHWDTPRVVNGSMNLTAMLDYPNNRIKIDYLGANGSRTFRVTLAKV